MMKETMSSIKTNSHIDEQNIFQLESLLELRKHSCEISAADVFSSLKSKIKKKKRKKLGMYINVHAIYIYIAA